MLHRIAGRLTEVASRLSGALELRSPRVLSAGLGALSLLVFLLLGIAAGLQGKLGEPDVRAVSGVFDSVSVKGRTGATPVVTVDQPVSVSTLKWEEAAHGDGRDILAGSPVLLGIYTFSAEDGSSLSPSALPHLVTGLASADSLGAELTELVVGLKEGARLVIIRPLASGVTEIDVVDVLPVVASGNPVPQQEGPLEVEMTDAGPLIRHQGNPPASSTVQTLIEGTGDQVHPGDTVVMQHLTQRWTDGSVVASTWGTGIPEAMPVDKMMVGLRNALIDRKIGSRLALTIPPDEASGEDTLIVVVDILGTEPPA